MMDEARGRRYALYYTPAPEHPLRQAAAQWLGRDVFGQVDTFANDSEFDHFRAQMTTRDLQRRLRARLDETGTTNFEWSYPCVFERFRFHMTLTGPVAIDERKGAARCQETRFQQRLTKTSPSDEITLFEQQSQKSDFVAILRFEFRELQRVAG